MRTLIIISGILFSNSLFSQTWQTIYGAEVSPINVFTGSGLGGTIASKWFKINPYDNSMWMGWGDKVQVIRNDGTLELFDYTTVPLLQQNGNMIEFEFTPTLTYLVDENFGLFSYDGSNWVGDYFGSGGNHICSDADTVWMGRSNNTNYIYSYNGFSFQGNNTFLRRIISRNGIMWVSPSSTSGSICRYSNDIVTIYSPDTSMLLDNTNYDFKFAKKTDTLYVSGALGLSLAHNNAFIDTITPGNSTNMPSGEIIEFEFDNENNIWAVFGSSTFYPNAIAYYDQATETWTQIYDSNNSPVNYNLRISIEVDTAGNLWVANGQNLHVLKINNPPAWLELQEQEKPFDFSIYPNPVKEELFIQSEDIEAVKIMDLNGKVLFVSEVTDKIFIENLEAGIYLLLAESKTGEVLQKRFVKE